MTLVSYPSMNDEQIPLSDREQEVLRLLAIGASNQKIAYDLGIKLNTVKVHVRSVFNKIGVSSRTEAALYAARVGLISLNDNDNNSNNDAREEQVQVKTVAEKPTEEQVQAKAVVEKITVVPQDTPSRESVPKTSADSTESMSSVQVEHHPSLSADPTVSLQQEEQSSDTDSASSTSVLSSETESSANPDTNAPATTTTSIPTQPLQPQPVMETVNQPTHIANPSHTVPLAAKRSWHWYVGRGVVIVLGIVLLAFLVALFEKVLTPQTPTLSQIQSVTEPINSTTRRWSFQRSLPTARAGSAAVSYGGYVYIIAGENKNGVSNSTMRFDPLAQSWETLTEKSIATTDVQAALIHSKIYVPGGQAIDGTVTRQVEVYDPIEDTWTTVKPLPKPRSAYGLASLDGRLYLFGGWDGRRYCDDVFVYTPSTDTWESASPMPTARAYPGIAVFAQDGKIYVMGGEDEQGTLAVNEQYIPAQEGNQPWHIRVPMPKPNSQFGVGFLSNFIYIIGGITAQSYSYDIRTDSWSEIEAPPNPIGTRPVVANGDDSLFIFGGYADQVQDRVLKYRAFYMVNIPQVRR